jgi:hypothetical protein
MTSSIVNSGQAVPSQIVTFDVSAAWKGVSQSSFAVRTSSVLYRVQFEVGSHWLISTQGEGGFVTVCDLPLRLDDADEALAVLGSPSYVNLEGISTRFDHFTSVVRSSFKAGPVTYPTDAYPQFFLALILAMLALLATFGILWHNKQI